MKKKKLISGHDHKRLFQSLPIDIQNNVRQKLPEERFKISFDKYLEENKNDFEEWRYSYEQPVLASSDFLKAFSEAILEVVESCTDGPIVIDWGRLWDGSNDSQK